MPRQQRIATFNLESLEVGRPGTLERRLAVLRPRLLRLDADLLCLQEVCEIHNEGLGDEALAFG
ncbi:MAG: hypothetical protein WD270_10825 [Acetobacterales bacterium]